MSQQTINNDLLKFGNANFFSNAHGETSTDDYHPDWRDVEMVGSKDLKWNHEYYWEGAQLNNNISYLPTYAINVVQSFNAYFQIITTSIYDYDENCKYKNDDIFGNDDMNSDISCYFVPGIDFKKL